MRFLVGLVAFSWVAAAALASDGAPIPEAREDGEARSTNRWDVLHDSVYDTVQRGVEAVDRWFVPPGTEPRHVPESRFRLGMFGTLETGAGTNGSFEATPLVDGDIDLSLPNAEDRLRLLITTTDPTAVPEESLENRDTSLRVGVMRNWWDSWNATVGVKTRIPPDAYAKVTWGRRYDAGPVQLYPHQKVYVEASEGLGAVSSIMADYWRGRLDFKYSGSLKWSEELEDRFRGGWLWEQSVGCLYVDELLDERDYDRRVRGGDVANGGGGRVFVSGGFDAVSLYRISVFTKKRIFSDWLFRYIVPEVEWRDEDDWKVNYKLTFGVEALFWGPARP